MAEKSFVRYWSSESVHDGKVRQVKQDSDRLRVLIETAEGRLVSFEFSGVQSVKQNRPEGMILYSLSEMEGIPPFRSFSFVNWDDDDESYLEVVAMEMTSDESASDHFY